AAAISIAGVVLSQPHRSTTPSTGLARMDSSTSIAIRFRYSMAVGLISDSPSDIVGNSSGNPPACQTPRLTASARSRRCELHGASSEKLLAMPMTGRPSNTSGVNPSARTHERCRKPSRPGAPNHAALRRVAPAAAGALSASPGWVMVCPGSCGMVLIFAEAEQGVHAGDSEQPADARMRRDHPEFVSLLFEAVAHR